MTKFVLLLAIVLVAASRPRRRAPSTELEFLGQQIFPTATQFQGTTFGGLSSIAYDERRGVFYVISDDQVDGALLHAPDRRRRPALPPSRSWP